MFLGGVTGVIFGAGAFAAFGFAGSTKDRSVSRVKHQQRAVVVDASKRARGDLVPADTKAPPGMRVCSRSELNLNYAGDRGEGSAPSSNGSVCHMTARDSGAMVPREDAGREYELEHQATLYSATGMEPDAAQPTSPAQSK